MRSRRFLRRESVVNRCGRRSGRLIAGMSGADASRDHSSCTCTFRTLGYVRYERVSLAYLKVYNKNPERWL